MKRLLESVVCSHKGQFFINRGVVLGVCRVQEKDKWVQEPPVKASCISPTLHLITKTTLSKTISVIGIVGFLFIAYMVADTVQTVLLAV